MAVEDGEIAWSRPSQQEEDEDQGTSSTITLAKEFRSKVKFMTKKWAPISKQNDRDRLELYSLAKQALKGDAPPSPSPTISIIEKTKYLAWKTKTGMSCDDAKTAFILESDRQMRVYGSKDPPIPSALVITEIMSSSKKAKAKRRAAAAAAAGGVSSEDDEEDDDDDSVGSFGSYSFIDDLSTTSSLVSKDSTLFSTPSRYVKTNDGTWSVSVPKTPQQTSTKTSNSSTNSSPLFKPNEQHQKTKNDVAGSVSSQQIPQTTPTAAVKANNSSKNPSSSKPTREESKTKNGGTGSLSVPKTPQSTTPSPAAESTRSTNPSSSVSSRQQQKATNETGSLSVPQTPQPTPISGDNFSNKNVGVSSRGTSSTNLSVARRRPQQQQPFRGLPAIRLLCVAASESRPSYVRRMQSTGRNGGWWKRQVPLSVPSPPSSNSAIIEGLVGFPETLVIWTAGIVEEITLMSIGTVPSTVVVRDGPRHQHRQHQHQKKNIVGKVVTSFLWPFHQLFLVIWMLTILYVTTIQTTSKFAIEMIVGRPGSGIGGSGSVDDSGMRESASSRMSKREWDANMESIAQSIVHMSAPKQSLSVRLAAMMLMPIPTVLNALNGGVGRSSSVTVAKSIIFMIFLTFTWWYWGLVIPLIMCCLLWNFIGAGVCFSLIDLAGVK